MARARITPPEWAVTETSSLACTRAPFRPADVPAAEKASPAPLRSGLIWAVTAPSRTAVADDAPTATAPTEAPRVNTSTLLRSSEFSVSEPTVRSPSTWVETWLFRPTCATAAPKPTRPPAPPATVTAHTVVSLPQSIWVLPSLTEWLLLRLRLSATALTVTVGRAPPSRAMTRLRLRPASTALFTKVRPMLPPTPTAPAAPSAPGALMMDVSVLATTLARSVRSTELLTRALASLARPLLSRLPMSVLVLDEPCSSASSLEVSALSLRPLWPDEPSSTPNTPLKPEVAPEAASMDEPPLLLPVKAPNASGCWPDAGAVPSMTSDSVPPTPAPPPTPRPMA